MKEYIKPYIEDEIINIEDVIAISKDIDDIAHYGDSDFEQ